DEAWGFQDKEEWDPEWTGKIDITEIETPKADFGMVRAWIPYLLIAFFLILTRLEIFPFKEWLTSVDPGVENLFGTDISPSWQILYSPGAVFIVISLITFFVQSMEPANYANAWKMSWKTMIPASAALVFTVPMVQVFINSGGGAAGYDEMPAVLAEGVANLGGSVYPIVAPFIGGLGAFVAGSNTISNMM